MKEPQTLETITLNDEKEIDNLNKIHKKFLNYSNFNLAVDSLIIGGLGIYAATQFNRDSLFISALGCVIMLPELYRDTNARKINNKAYDIAIHNYVKSHMTQ